MICRQTPYNEVQYMTSDVNRMQYISYNDFLKRMLQYPLAKRPEFKHELDTFNVIYIILETGEWEIKKSKIEKSEASFEDLVSLNSNEKEEKSKFDEKLEKGRKYIQRNREFKFYGE